MTTKIPIHCSFVFRRKQRGRLRLRDPMLAVSAWRDVDCVVKRVSLNGPFHISERVWNWNENGGKTSRGLNSLEKSQWRWCLGNFDVTGNMWAVELKSKQTHQRFGLELWRFSGKCWKHGSLVVAMTTINWNHCPLRWNQRQPAFMNKMSHKILSFVLGGNDTFTFE